MLNPTPAVVAVYFCCCLLLGEPSEQLEVVPEYNENLNMVNDEEI